MCPMTSDYRCPRNSCNRHADQSHHQYFYHIIIASAAQCLLQQRNAYNTHTHALVWRPFSQCQKGRTNRDFTEARDSEWQWHQLGSMQVCTSLQTDNHASTPPLTQIFTGRMPFLPPNQQRQSTEGTCTSSDINQTAKFCFLSVGSIETSLCQPCDKSVTKHIL